MVLTRAVPVGLGLGAGELSPHVPPECNLQINNTRTTTFNYIWLTQNTFISG